MDEGAPGVHHPEACEALRPECADLQDADEKRDPIQGTSRSNGSPRQSRRDHKNTQGRGQGQGRLEWTEVRPDVCQPLLKKVSEGRRCQGLLWGLDVLLRVLTLWFLMTPSCLEIKAEGLWRSLSAASPRCTIWQAVTLGPANMACRPTWEGNGLEKKRGTTLLLGLLKKRVQLPQVGSVTAQRQDYGEYRCRNDHEDPNEHRNLKAFISFHDACSTDTLRIPFMQDKQVATDAFESPYRCSYDGECCP